MKHGKYYPRLHSNKNRPAYPMNPLYITVHNTSNTAKGADAASHARYVKNPETATSWHFTVDDEKIYQHLPLNENGWHAGDGNGTGNRKSIGIEICENSDGDFEKAVSNAQWLIKKLMKEQGFLLLMSCLINIGQVKSALGSCWTVGIHLKQGSAVLHLRRQKRLRKPPEIPTQSKKAILFPKLQKSTG